MISQDPATIMRIAIELRDTLEAIDSAVLLTGQTKEAVDSALALSACLPTEPPPQIFDATLAHPDAKTLIARAARIAREGCLVPPDGGSPTEDERQMCARIAENIEDLL